MSIERQYTRSGGRDKQLWLLGSGQHAHHQLTQWSGRQLHSCAIDMIEPSVNGICTESCRTRQEKSALKFSCAVEDGGRCEALETRIRLRRQGSDFNSKPTLMRYIAPEAAKRVFHAPSHQP
jgi:hypothetical protein